MRLKSVFGWLILLGALAVPAVMFWNWWARMQNSSQQFDAVRKQGAGPAPFGGVSMMQSSQEAAVKGPQSPEARAVLLSPEGEAAKEADATALVAAAQAAPALAPVASTSTAPGSESDGSLAAAAASTPVSESAPVQPVAGGLDAIVFAPNTERDPMISPSDRKTEEEVNRPKPIAVEPPEAPVRCEEKLEVQGVVMIGGRRMVLINNERYREGESVEDAVIRRITSSAVYLRCGARQVAIRLE